MNDTVIAAVGLLLNLTAGYVHFDSSSPLQAHKHGITFAAAEVACATPNTDVQACTTRQYVIRTNGTDILVNDPYLAAHELGHVVDLLDDGNANGSPGHKRTDLLVFKYYSSNHVNTQHCLSSDAEWYACEVARTGTIK